MAEQKILNLGTKILTTQKRSTWSAIFLALIFMLVQAVPVFADSRPYFVSNDGSVFAGGWFYQGGNCVTTDATYQAPNYSDLNNTRFDGAILAFANSGATRGAHSNLDALALGLIEGGSSDRGFYSANGSSPPKYLSLSNVDSTSPSQGAAFWGGLLEGNGAKPDHCIPDYFTTKQDGPNTSFNNIDLGRSNGQYLISGNVTFNGGTVNAVSPTSGRELTYFVNGNVRITGNVTYGSHNADNVPKLAVVVRGNIFVDPSVTRLDGWYIAQPNGTNDGNFWTCHDGSTSNQMDDIWVRANCNQTLRINGAVTARQVNLLRINGGLGSSSPTTSAEVFTYTPQMVIGGPFFNQPPNTEGGIQSLISLPPVF